MLKTTPSNSSTSIKTPYLFALVAGLWLVVIGGIVGWQELRLRNDREIILKVEPVDPYDIFRGEYVRLSYSISRIPVGEIDAVAMELNPGSPIYVTLKPAGEYMVRDRTYSIPPPADQVFIKGQIIRPVDDAVLVEYGIEQYFVPQGKAMRLQTNRDLNLTMKVAIGQDGQARIIKLLENGQPVNLE